MVDPALKAPGRRLRTGCETKSGTAVSTAPGVLGDRDFHGFWRFWGVPGGLGAVPWRPCGLYLVLRPLRNRIFFDFHEKTGAREESKPSFGAFFGRSWVHFSLLEAVSD